MTNASVQGCPTHTAFLPYIFTPSFPGVTHREAIVYISVWIIVSGQKTEDRVYVGHHKYKTIFSFRASFFDSGIEKRDGVAAIPLESMFSVVFIDVPFSLCNRLHHICRLR